MKLVFCGYHSDFSTYSTFEWEHLSLPRKILLTVLWATLSLQILLIRHWHNIFLLNTFSWDRWGDSVKLQHLDAIKLSSRIVSIVSLVLMLVCSWAESFRNWSLSTGNLVITRRIMKSDYVKYDRCYFFFCISFPCISFFANILYYFCNFPYPTFLVRVGLIVYLWWNLHDVVFNVLDCSIVVKDSEI